MASPERAGIRVLLTLTFQNARFSAAGRRAAERMLMAKRSGDTHVAATRLEFHPALIAVAPSSCATVRTSGGENIGDKTCLEV